MRVRFSTASSRRPLELKAASASTWAPSSSTIITKSRIVQKWMFWVSYQGSGKVRVTGMRPVNSNEKRTRQWPKFGKETMALRPMRKSSETTSFGFFVA